VRKLLESPSYVTAFDTSDLFSEVFEGFKCVNMKRPVGRRATRCPKNLLWLLLYATVDVFSLIAAIWRDLY
jgi:hypothetical protein